MTLVSFQAPCSSSAAFAGGVFFSCAAAGRSAAPLVAGPCGRTLNPTPSRQIATTTRAAFLSFVRNMACTTPFNKARTFAETAPAHGEPADTKTADRTVEPTRAAHGA